KSAHLYPYFDYAHGYGIPQAGYFTDAKNTVAFDSASQIQPTFYFVILNNTLQVTLDEKYAFADMEKFLGYKPVRNLYYRVDAGNGTVRFYAVVLAEQKDVLLFQRTQFQPGD